MTQFLIPVIDYQSAKPGHPIALPPSPFLVNDRQLIVSMVRSTLTANAGKKSRKYMAAIVKPTLQFLLDWNRAPALCVSSDFLDVLRDFSATTRIGELAQGVSYAFWKWERGYSWISDFESWVAGVSPAYTEKKSPDFVMWNPITNEIAFMESKGTGSACYKAPMRKALSQCKTALCINSVSRGFGCVLTLDSRSPTGVGTLHIRDPEEEFELSDDVTYDLFLRSYASWFDLVGDEERRDACQQGHSARSGTFVNSQRFVRNASDSNNFLQDITTVAIGFDPARTSYGIDSEIDNALTNIDAFKKIKWNEFSKRMKRQSRPQEKQLFFPDGTFIVEHTA